VVEQGCTPAPTREVDMSHGDASPRSALLVRLSAKPQMARCESEGDADDGELAAAALRKVGRERCHPKGKEGMGLPTRERALLEARRAASAQVNTARATQAS
jgi:hypothetical protein